jgi:hypothetical protein
MSGVSGPNIVGTPGISQINNLVGGSGPVSAGFPPTNLGDPNINIQKLMNVFPGQ